MTNSDASNPVGPAGGPDDSGVQLRLELYLDGSLDEAQKVRFEAEVAASPALREALELERRIEGSLRRQFTPPAFDTIAVSSGTRARPSGFSLRRVGLVAAACLLVGVGVLLNTFYTAMHSGPQRVRPTLAAVYTTTMAKGFVPDEVCTTDEEFAGWTKDRFGTALSPSKAQAGVEFVGWSSSGSISPYTGVLLARVEGEPVLVFIDTIENERALGRPEAALDSAVAAPSRGPTFRPRGSADRANDVATPDGTSADRGTGTGAAMGGNSSSGSTPAEASTPEEECPDVEPMPLRLHRREVAGLVLYEVSPFETARIVDELVVR